MKLVIKLCLPLLMLNVSHVFAQDSMTSRISASKKGNIYVPYQEPDPNAQSVPYVVITTSGSADSSLISGLQTLEERCKTEKLPGCSQLMENKNLQQEVTKTIDQTVEAAAPQKGASTFINKLVEAVVFTPGDNVLLFLPILDSSRDLGINVGIMPVYAIRDKQGEGISHIIAPSFNYNNYLKTSVVYRHYYLPGENRLVVGRASYSGVVQREVFLRYFDQKFLDSRIRVNAEFRYWVNGKASYYGQGPDSKEYNQATYALNMLGEELTVGLPLTQRLFIDFTHSYYSQYVSEGPVKTIDQLADKYPGIYSQNNNAKDYMFSKFSLYYDATDHPFIPKIGSYLGVSYGVGIKGLLSTYNYNVYTAQMKQYFNYKNEDRFVTALNAVIQYQTGDTLPFYAQSALGERTGLRNVGDGRFVDRGKFNIALEQRMVVLSLPLLQFITELETTPFVDIGTVFNKMDGIRMDKMKVAYGIALRALIRPQLVCTAEFAFGRDGNNVIINVDYPF